MPSVDCPRTGCTFQTADMDNMEHAMTMLKIHAGEHDPVQQQQAPIQHPVPRGETVKRPSIETGVTLEAWVFFKSCWTRYKKLAQIQPQLVTAQLLECAEKELLLDLHRNNGSNLDNLDEEHLLGEMRRLAVHGESQIISRVKFRNLCQDHQEDVRHYAARVKGQASLCNYTITCSRCADDLSYADEEIMDQICTGLADAEIQKEVLALRKQNQTIEELVGFIEDREAGKRSQTALSSSASVSKISQYRKNKDKPPDYSPKADNSELCSYCGERGHGRRASRRIRQQKCKAYNIKCEKCGRLGHDIKMCYANENTNKVTPISQQTDFVSSIETAETEQMISSLKLSHQEYNDLEGWTSKKTNAHPSVTVLINVSEEDYTEFKFPLAKRHLRSVTRTVIADTGAMTMVAGRSLVTDVGLKVSDLIPVNIELSAANNSKLKILGAMFIKVSGTSRTGEKLVTRQLCYVQENDDRVYLSKKACECLGLISKNFPSIGDCVSIVKSDEILNSRCTKVSSESITCSCPKRVKPPAVPSKLPYEPTPENRPKLKQWIIDRYRASSFNVCENQELVKMSGPPLKLDVDPNVTPHAVHTPLPVPIHWQAEVKAQLDRDCRLGVIEPVPWGEPTTWCSRMVTVAKSNGSPRRTIDLQPLNDAALRHTHHTPPPFHLAMSVPHHTIKTVLDAWNGYHSLPIREEDRSYTTFITPWGRYRYCCAPQGFLASADGYTRRFDEIIAEITDKVKCVDDTLLWGEGIEKSFFKTCEFLTLCGEYGITLNPTKFQFAEDEVEFAGFNITPTNVQPSDRYLDAILNFPVPTDITGMRSWFGLVNQSAYAFSMAEKMAPFRELLKPGNKFIWNENLQELFDKSKEEIVHAVENGVRLFDPQKRTALVTDWSKTGTGFSLMQKHCNCSSDIPTCCREGWKLVFAGSQFNNKAEARYAPIEGECLAVVKALKKPTVKYFIHGCKDLIIATDHKPLVKLLGNRKLEDIDNPRLLSLKEKTLSYRFSMRYVAGARNKVPDAASRFPTGLSDATEDMDSDTQEAEQTVYITAISALFSLNEVKATTWEKVQEATASDFQMLELLNAVQDGFKQSSSLRPSHLKPYVKLRRSLTTVDGVVMYKKRIVVPPQLRQDILTNLHSAHQGISSMISRAEDAVFWPGITSDIHRIREQCSQCNRNAPSQPRMPPTSPILPEYPFQSLCGDYCTLQGTNYLITVDRYSNWPSVQRGGPGEANSKGLITEIKKHCATFGIPEELSSDGGPQFTSKETTSFMQNYGIRSRVSSVANPHSNCRAEVGVKTMKRLLADNTGPGGTLDNDKVLRAILQYRNTPDPETGFSPAEVLFGRQIRDFTPVLPGLYKPRDEWRQTMEMRERLLSRRHIKDHERWTEHTRALPPLKVGDHVFIQNQVGNHPKKWDKSGVIVEVRQHHQYVVKTDGSGIPTLRNRQFLRKFTPYNDHLKPAPTTTDHHPCNLPTSAPSATECKHTDKHNGDRGDDNHDKKTTEIAATPNCKEQMPELTPYKIKMSSPLPQNKSTLPHLELTPSLPKLTPHESASLPVHQNRLSLPRRQLDLDEQPTVSSSNKLATRSSTRRRTPVDRFQPTW